MDIMRLVASALLLTACATPQSPASMSSRFPGTDGMTHALVDPHAELTLLEFFSAHCPCQASHDARLKQLATRYRPLGVAFRAIDSELDASVEKDRTEARTRAYPYPILIDPEGRAARTLKADYATYTVLVDQRGKILFRGGIDSDRSHLTAAPTPYLENAIEDALAKRPLRLAEAKTLGCSLMVR